MDGLLFLHALAPPLDHSILSYPHTQIVCLLNFLQNFFLDESLLSLGLQ